MGSLK